MFATLDAIAIPDPDFTIPAPDLATSMASYRLYNIGNNQPVEFMDFIECPEAALGRKVVKTMLP